MEQSDTQLISKAKQGDAIAFEQLVYRYDKRVLTLALSFTRNEDDAKDIYQEVFIRAFRALPEFEERSDLMTWLHRITTNVCLSFLSEKERRRSSSIDELLDARANADEASDRQDITNALLKLSSQQRLAFLLKYDEGYKIKEIAVMLKCTEGTVKRHLFDATLKLKKILTD